MKESNRKQFVNLFIIISIIITIIISFSGLIAVGAAELPQFQQPPFILKASKMLPKDLLVGSNCRIRETVKNDGFVNTYNLDTDYGPLTVESTSLLMERVTELKALHHMEELKKKDAFVDALKKDRKKELQDYRCLFLYTTFLSLFHPRIIFIRDSYRAIRDSFKSNAEINKL